VPPHTGQARETTTGYVVGDATGNGWSADSSLSASELGAGMDLEDFAVDGHEILMTATGAIQMTVDSCPADGTRPRPMSGCARNPRKDRPRVICKSNKGRLMLAAMAVIGGATSLAIANGYDVTPTLITMEAYMELGPSAPRCLNKPIYTYDPRRERPDRAFLLDYPDDAAREYVRERFGVEPIVELVSVNLRNSDSTVRVRVPEANGTTIHWLLRLSPRGAQRVSVDLPSVEIMLCNKHHQGWYVVSQTPLDGPSGA